MKWSAITAKQMYRHSEHHAISKENFILNFYPLEQEFWFIKILAEI